YPPDILHCGDLGVAKHFICDVWTNSKNHDKAFYFNEQIRKRINGTLENIKPPKRCCMITYHLSFSTTGYCL
ncbi:unnamed protein product, partial [Allacma fusca]